MQGIHERLLDRTVIPNGLAFHVNSSLYVRQFASAEIEVRLNRKPRTVMGHDSLTVDQGLTHVAFFFVYHHLLPRGSHFLGMRSVVIRTGFIIHHTQPFIARRTVYIESVNGTAGKQFPDSLDTHRERPFLLQKVYLQPRLGVLTVTLQDIGDIALDDDILTGVELRYIGFGRRLPNGSFFVHCLVRRHERCLHLRLVRPNGFNRFGCDTHRLTVVTMHIGAVDKLHRMMHKRTEGIGCKEHLFFLLWTESEDVLQLKTTRTGYIGIECAG